jgi:methyl-accepting chemotaxis protein
VKSSWKGGIAVATLIGDLRVGVRLALTFAVLVILLLIIAFLGVSRLDALNAEFSYIVVDRHAKTNLLNTIIDKTNLMARSKHNMLLLNDAAEIKKEVARLNVIKTNIGDMLEMLDKAFANEQEEGKELLQIVHDEIGAYMVKLVRFTRLLEAGKREEARMLFNAQFGTELESVFNAMRKLSAYQTELMQQSQNDAQASYLSARNLIVGLAFISVVLSTLIVSWIARSITAPLNEAVRLAGLVAAGNLTVRSEMRGADETGQLMGALTKMNESLTTIVNQVRTSSDSIAEASREIVGGNRELLTRTEEQASSLEQASASMQEITETVKKNAGDARYASELAHKTSQVAEKGGKAVGEVVEKMDSINASSQKIVEIIGVINGIAFQTNILALNAAIEAARAGEQGRGFAVVAAEVRSLAKRSAAAAKEIKDLIQDSVSNVQEGTGMVDEAGRAVEDIVASIRELVGVVRGISTVSGEQSASIGQVNQVLSSMERITQQNAALAEETAAAVESLDMQTHDLVAAVSVFKLEGRDAEGSVAPEPVALLSDSKKRS